MRHQYRPRAAFDDVIQRRQRALDAVHIFHHALLHAVVVHAHERNFIANVPSVGERAYAHLTMCGHATTARDGGGGARACDG